MNRLRAWKRMGWGVVLFLVLGCRAPESAKPVEIKPVEKPPAVETPGVIQKTPLPAPPPAIPEKNIPNQAVSQARIIGHSVEQRPLECWIFGASGETVLLLATIHGNESAGTPLLRRLAAYLREHPALTANRRIALVPVANPDGLARRTRHNARGVDLNRNFPAANWRGRKTAGDAALSEPESAALHALLLELRPNRIISFHQPLGCIDYDGPTEALARALAAAARLPLRKLGGRPGSLGSYAGDALRVPTVTVELPASADALNEAALWARYGGLLVAAIDYPDFTFVRAGGATQWKFAADNAPINDSAREPAANAK